MKRLFRAAFYRVSKLVPRELLLLVMHSSLPPCSLKRWAWHCQEVSTKSRGQRGRQRNKLRRLVSSCFPSQRQGCTEGTLWLVNYILPVKAAYLPSSILAHYLLLNTSRATKQSHYAIKTVTIKALIQVWYYFFPQHFCTSPAFPFHTSCSWITHWPWCLQCWMW